MKRMSFGISLILAVVAGFTLSAAFPATAFWPLAFVGVFILYWSLIGRSFWTGFLVGTITGATFWLTLINWLTLYLGPVPELLSQELSLTAAHNDGHHVGVELGLSVLFWLQCGLFASQSRVFGRTGGFLGAGWLNRKLRALWLKMSRGLALLG